MDNEAMDVLTELVMKCDWALQKAQKTREESNSKIEIEAMLVELAVNEKEDPELIKKLKKNEKKISEDYKYIKKYIMEISEKMDEVREIYNNRIKGQTGEISTLGSEKND